MHAEPSNEVPEPHAAALRHLSAFGIPKSVLCELPASAVHTFEFDGTFAHACFKLSMRAVSASLRIHDRSPSEFHRSSRCPCGAGGGAVDGHGGIWHHPPPPEELEHHVWPPVQEPGPGDGGGGTEPEQSGTPKFCQFVAASFPAFGLHVNRLRGNWRHCASTDERKSRYSRSVLLKTYDDSV